MNGISLEIEGNPVSCRNTADDLRDLATDLQAVQPLLKEHAEIEDRDFSGPLGDEFRQQSARNLASASTRADQAVRFASALDQLARDMERAREMMDRVRALDPEGKVIVDDRISPTFAGSDWALFQQLHTKAGDARLFWIQAQNAYLKAVRAHTDLDPAALDSDVPLTPVNPKTPGAIRPLPDDYVPTPERAVDDPDGGGDPVEGDPSQERDDAPVGEGTLQSSHTLGSTGSTPAGVTGFDPGSGHHAGVQSGVQTGGQSGAGHLPMQQAAMAAPEPMRPQAQFLEPDDPDGDDPDGAHQESGWQPASGWQPDPDGPPDPDSPPDPGWQPASPPPMPDGPGWQPAEVSPEPSPSPGQPPVAVSPDPPAEESAPDAEPDQVAAPGQPTQPLPPQGPDEVAATVGGEFGGAQEDVDMDDTAEIRPIVDDDLRRAHLADRLGTD